MTRPLSTSGQDKAAIFCLQLELSGADASSVRPRGHEDTVL